MVKNPIIRLAFLSAALWLGFVLPASASDPGSTCNALRITTPTETETGALGINWEMSIADVEQLLGVKFPHPTRVNSIKDLAAPLAVGEGTIYVEAKEHDGRISELGLYAARSSGVDLLPCARRFRLPKSDMRTFRGDKESATGVRWKGTDIVVTFVAQTVSYELLRFSRRNYASPFTVSHERLSALAPGQFLTIQWNDLEVLVHRRTPDAAKVKPANGRGEEITYFQWLMLDSFTAIRAADLQYPELRSERREIGVYVLLSPSHGCSVNTISEDGILTALHDPCSGRTFDFTGRTDTESVALLIPHHYYDTDGNLVIGATDKNGIQESSNVDKWRDSQQGNRA